MSEVISSFRSLRTGWQVFSRLMLFICVILHTSGKNLELLYILPFGMMCMSAISMMFVKILLAVCILVGIVRAPIYRATNAFCIHMRTHSNAADL